MSAIAGTDITYPDVVVLVRWMAEEGGFGADDIADAVEKPWKWEAELAESRDWQAVAALGSSS